MNASALRATPVVFAWLATLAGLCTAADPGNPIYIALTGPGVKLSDKERLQLAKPALDDGLASAQQRQTIDTLLAGRYDWDTFARKSVVSPFLLKISEGAAEPGPITRNVDLYFIAYGSFDKLKSEEYLNKQINLTGNSDQTDSSGQAITLKPDELSKRKITAGTNSSDPRWIAVNSTLLGKVRISLTTQNIKTEGSDSITIASVTDPRFANDPDYPNTWRSLTVDDAGQRQVGNPEPYTGLGSYVKATRLAEPAGAMFIEYHVTFIEPEGWFHGTNLLRSKLPIVAQEMVRKFRRNLGE